MGWFDEQIRNRQRSDEEVFEESFVRIAGAVMGRTMAQALNDDRQQAEDAIGEILKYYRLKPQEMPAKLRDMNEALEFQLRPGGIMRRTVYLEEGWQKDASGAMLATLREDGRVVALIPTGVRGYSYIDRKLGKKIRITGKNAGIFNREAIAFYKPFPLKAISMKELIRYIAEQIEPTDLAALLGCMLAVTLVGMLVPEINRRLFSDVLASGRGTVLMGAAIFLVGVTVSMVMIRAAQNLMSARIRTRLDVNIEAATMMRILSLPVGFFKQYSAGELSNRSQYLNTLANMLVDTVLSTGFSSLLSLLYINQIFLYAPSLVVPALMMTLLTLLVTVVTVALQMKVTRQQMLLGSKESGMSYSLISGIQKIRLSGAEKRAFARWGRLYAQSAELSYNPPLLLRVSSVITSGISLIGTMVLYYTAIRNHIQISEYYAFSSAYGMVNAAFLALAGMGTSLASIKPVLEMVKPIMETVPEISENKKMVSRFSGTIELNNVTFRYRDDMPPVLDNLTLKVRAGQYVAIVGKTGCGKSTLMRIMLGFETPQKGGVFYDGRDMRDLDLKSLRQHIGTVLQNGSMFNGDIYSNIVISAPWLTVDDAWEAAETAGLADDIRAMPMGMYTLISEGQGGISGGQRQRLLIARAVAPKPKILMFDEATSALDNLTQKQVSEALDRMKCTRIVIAHRLSTIRRCDRIIVLDKGRIVEDGTYEALIEKGGAFAELVARQRLDVPEETVS